MGEIPADAEALLTGESFAAYVTLFEDGRPHVTPVWIDYDAETGEVLVNTAEGRLKDRNVTADPRVAVMVMATDDPYTYISIQGTAERTTDGAVDHIDSLAQRYMGVDEYPHHGEESGPRVVHRITPEHVIW